jgi:hypothetical protein
MVCFPYKNLSDFIDRELLVLTLPMSRIFWDSERIRLSIFRNNRAAAKPLTIQRPRELTLLFLKPLTCKF